MRFFHMEKVICIQFKVNMFYYAYTVFYVWKKSYVNNYIMRKQL